jgi:hypothetical protein
MATTTEIRITDYLRALTEPTAATAFAEQLTKAAALATVHAEAIRATAYQTPWSRADQQRLDEALEAAPAVLSVESALDAAKAHQQAHGKRCAERAERYARREADLELIRTGAVRAQ